MTTVVYDGKILAADSQATGRSDGTACGVCGDESSDRIRINARKLHVIDDRQDGEIMAWAGAGRAACLDAVSSAIRKGLHPKAFLECLGPVVAPGSSLTLIYITAGTPHRAFRLEWDAKLKVKTDEITGQVTAIGSGTPAAVGAHQWMGADAIEMVAMAIDSDIYSGGKIASVCLTDKAPEIKRHADPQEIRDQVLSRINKPTEPEKPKRTRTPRKKETAK